MVLILIFWFLTAGHFLVVNQHPVRSSVIIVLGGGGGERELQASKLYKEKYAPYVVLSDGGTRWNPSTFAGKIEIASLKTYGVPGTAIIPELHAQSTYGNAVYTKSIMIQHHFTSAIVVSSSYHMRRAQLYLINSF
ncbi:YdcF family protein [Alicyclobacillus tolerans]|uniref:YdcF family protein n=1 Tax=Alicyclobacillus tolerans TaxID=90970 RepID=UPI003558D250|nr:YdcF family protein [Alicyclobacillus tolerans]